MDKDTWRKPLTVFKDACFSSMLKLVYHITLYISSSSALWIAAGGKKTHKFLTKVTQGLGSTTSSCQTSARFRALTLHKHLQSLVKKKKRFLTFLKNKPLAFLDTVALKITDFLVCCCCFFFFYSNTKYFLHYQFSHFKASIVKQHTYIARTPYSPLQTPTDEHFQTCEYFCDYSNKGEVQIEHHCKQLF